MGKRNKREILTITKAVHCIEKAAEVYEENFKQRDFLLIGENEKGEYHSITFRMYDCNFMHLTGTRLYEDRKTTLFSEATEFYRKSITKTLEPDDLHIRNQGSYMKIHSLSDAMKVKMLTKDFFFSQGTEQSSSGLHGHHRIDCDYIIGSKKCALATKLQSNHIYSVPVSLIPEANSFKEAGNIFHVIAVYEEKWKEKQSKEERENFGDKHFSNMIYCHKTFDYEKLPEDIQKQCTYHDEFEAEIEEEYLQD